MTEKSPPAHSPELPDDVAAAHAVQHALAAAGAATATAVSNPGAPSVAVMLHDQQAGARHCCHCRQPRGGGDGVLCAECHEWFHKKCLLPSTERAQLQQGYVCSHCRPGGHPIPRGQEPANCIVTDPHVRREYYTLKQMTTASLKAAIRQRCLLPASVNIIGKKDVLVRRLLYARLGVDLTAQPPPPNKLQQFTIRPRARTVAELVYTSVEALSLVYPHAGLGVEKRPNASGPYGLLPHVMRHLRVNFFFHLARAVPAAKTEGRRLFARFFVGGVDHWLNHHQRPQCMRDNQCGCSGATLDDDDAADALRTTLTVAMRQYARADRTENPWQAEVDISLANDTTNDAWFGQHAQARQ